MNNHSTRLGILMALMYSMGMHKDFGISPGQKIDYSKMNPPQSEESKQYYKKRAAEKRKRKCITTSNP